MNSFFRVGAGILGVAMAAETSLELGLSALGIDLINSNLDIRWVAVGLSGLVGIYSAFFKYQEIKKNIHQEHGTYQEIHQEPGAYNDDQEVSNCRNNSFLGLFGLGLVLSASARGAQTYFQAGGMLSAQNIIMGSSELYAGIRLGSTIMNAIYCAGTEGMEPLHWLEKNNYINEHDRKTKKTVSNCIKLLIAIPGSFNHAALEALSLYLLLEKFELEKFSLILISGFVFLDLWLQNYLFQGKKFLENFESENQNDNPLGPINPCKKVFYQLLKSLFLIAPSVAAHGALALYTLKEGLVNTNRLHITNFDESFIEWFAVGGAAVSTLGDSLSEAWKTSKEADQKIMPITWLKRPFCGESSGDAEEHRRLLGFRNA